MRLIGLAERTLEKMCRRAQGRVAVGKPLSEQTVTQERIAESRIMIEQSRLLTLKAAYMMDTVGNKIARSEIAMIKVAVPNMACRVIDWAIQMFGGGGGTGNDYGLGLAYATARLLRIADGPDEVHRNQIARLEMRRYPAEAAVQRRPAAERRQRALPSRRSLLRRLARRAPRQFWSPDFAEPPMSTLAESAPGPATPHQQGRDSDRPRAAGRSAPANWVAPWRATQDRKRNGKCSSARRRSNAEPDLGRSFANRLRRRRPRPGDKWHLHEVFVRIQGVRHYLWRGVDQHGVVLDILVQERRDAKAAKRFFRRLLKRLDYVPRVIMTDKLRSHGVAKRHLLPNAEQRQSRDLNNQAQDFLSAHAFIHGHFHPRRHLLAADAYRALRSVAFDVWHHETCTRHATRREQTSRSGLQLVRPTLT
jgi:transposase-like protein